MKNWIEQLLCKKLVERAEKGKSHPCSFELHVIRDAGVPGRSRILLALSFSNPSFYSHF